MAYRARERALIAQTMLDLVKIVRAGRLGGVHSIDTLIISAAIVVGDAVGKPKTAAEIARQVDVPRATVVRKLSQLVRTGMAEKDGTRYRMKNVPSDTRYIDEGIATIRRAKLEIK